MGWVTSGGSGQYRVAERHIFWCDRLYKTDQSRRVIVWCHGAGGNYQLGPHEKTFAEAGLPVIATDLGGGQTWGSDASLTAVDEAWAYAKTTFGAKTDKMVLWAGSMGSLTALLYAQSNPSNVAAVGCALPVVDPEDVRVNDRGGFQSEIEAIYGVATSVPDAKRPSQNTGSYSVPIHFFTSSTDNVGIASLADTFDTAVASCATTNIGALGHSYLAMDNAPARAFLAQYI